MTNIHIYNSYIENLQSSLLRDINVLSYNLSYNIGNKKSQIGALAKLKDSYNCLELIQDKIYIAYEKSLKQ